MAEALHQVKRRFGRGAVIVHTRTVREGGWLGLGGRPMVEITAADPTLDLPADAASPRIHAGAPPQRRPESGAVSDSGGRDGGRQVPNREGGLSRPGARSPGGQDIARKRLGPGQADGAATAMAHARTKLAEPSPTLGDPSGPTRDRLSDELCGLKQAVHELAGYARRSCVSALPESLADAYLRLVKREVADDIASRLVERIRAELGDEGVRDGSAVDDCLARFVESMLPVGGPIRLSRTSHPTAIALVGPTGVGKTTTIAKLAANFSLREGRKVGLITIDTFRIAAVEQLRTYARIVNVPLEVVVSVDQMRPALHALRDREVVFIDTPGRSQNDRIRLNELKCFLDQAEPHEVHLVLASTCGQDVLLDVVERYRELHPNRVIFTKLDEAIGFGAILTCVSKAQARLSYVTTGQDVPDDIEVVRGRRLADLIVRGTRLAVG